MSHPHELVLIIDFGAINAQMVAKAVRQLQVYCEVLPHTTPLAELKAKRPQAIILQRGAAVGAEDTTATPPSGLAELGVPLLDLKTSGYSAELLQRFLLTECKLRQDWTIERFIEESVATLRTTIGERQVLLGLSGGVDSAVAALLLQRAVGRQLVCVFVDHGLMRLGEPQQVVETFRHRFGINLVAVAAEERFLTNLAGVSDPEAKRKVIGELFIRLFEEEARKLGDIDYLVQGTIYSDVIESGRDGGKQVKSHHNVGGLPERIAFKGVIEPLRSLFKDEVRAVGRTLGLPAALTERQPFPGPGLGVRCLGELTREKLEMLRAADAIFCRALETQGYGDRASQYFAVLTDNRSVGVTDGARTYGRVVALRAVKTLDFMTATVSPLPLDFLVAVGEEIATTVPGVNRVVYDITGKPPGTIEWE